MNESDVEVERVSHYYQSKNGTAFNFNSDLSGDVEIVDERKRYEGTWRFDVNGDDLLEFIDFILKQREISRLELK